MFLAWRNVRQLRDLALERIAANEVATGDPPSGLRLDRDRWSFVLLPISDRLPGDVLKECGFVC